MIFKVFHFGVCVTLLCETTKIWKKLYKIMRQLNCVSLRWWKKLWSDWLTQKLIELQLENKTFNYHRDRDSFKAVTMMTHIINISFAIFTRKWLKILVNCNRLMHTNDPLLAPNIVCPPLNTSQIYTLSEGNSC